VERIKADHKLIDTLAANLIKWNDQGNESLVAERVPLFYRLLVDHNASEETDLFPRWDKIQSAEAKSSVKDALSIIESFGVKEYLNATCLNESALNYIFRAPRR
jgi:hemerythrin superfamily protein